MVLLLLYVQGNSQFETKAKTIRNDKERSSFQSELIKSLIEHTRQVFILSLKQERSNFIYWFIQYMDYNSSYKVYILANTTKNV